MRLASAAAANEARRLRRACFFRATQPSRTPLKFMLRPCPSCPCPDVEREKWDPSRTNRVVTGRLSRVAVTAARTPRVGRTEGKGRRTFSVARNLGPARGASATARTPRAGSAVSRGVAAHATLHLDAQTEAIAALAVPGTAVDPCVSRDGSGHSGDRPTGAHSARFVGRHVTRPTALLGAFCAGRCADLCFFFDNSASFTTSQATNRTVESRASGE